MDTERPGDGDERLRLGALALPQPQRNAIGDRLEAAARTRQLRRRWSRALVGAALLASAAAAVLLVRLGSDRAGSVTHLRTTAGDFQLLPLGERGVAFVSEETDVELQSPAVLRLNRGSVRLVVRRHQGQPFVVITRAAEVEVLGTEFDVTASERGTEVRVVRGEVEVRNPQGRRRLWPREAARVRAGEAPRMVVPVSSVVVDGPAEILERR